MDPQSDIRALKHQVTLLNIALHSIAHTMGPAQKRDALKYFSEGTQFAQSKLESSAVEEDELKRFIDLRESIERALGQ